MCEHWEVSGGACNARPDFTQLEIPITGSLGAGGSSLPQHRWETPMDPDQDSEDDLYAYPKAQPQRLPPVLGPIAPLEYARKVLRDYQEGEKIARPNMAQSFIPVVGPAWEAAADLQDGNYGGAAFNGAMAVADALPVGTAVKGIRAAAKGIGVLKKGSLTANAAAKAYRRAGMAGVGEEIHHTVPLNGTSRQAQDWRNHYAFLKNLPIEQHRRQTGSWLRDGVRMPQYGPLGKAWYGTTDWMKTVPVGLAAYAADAVENLSRANFAPPARPPSKPTR